MSTKRVNTDGSRPSSTGKGRGVNHKSWRRQLQASRIKFDDEAKRIYLTQLAEHGRKGDAGRAAGVSLSTVHQHRKNDPEFAEAEAQADNAYRDQIAAVVYDRGVNGWWEPLYSRGVRVLDVVTDENGIARRDAQGEIMYKPAMVWKFSERFVEIEAKRVEPAYRERGGVEINGGDGPTQIVVNFVDPPDWDSGVEWGPDGTPILDVTPKSAPEK